MEQERVDRPDRRDKYAHAERDPELTQRRASVALPDIPEPQQAPHAPVFEPSSEIIGRLQGEITDHYKPSDGGSGALIQRRARGNMRSRTDNPSPGRPRGRAR